MKQYHSLSTRHFVKRVTIAIIIMFFIILASISAYKFILTPEEDREEQFSPPRTEEDPEEQFSPRLERIQKSNAELRAKVDSLQLENRMLRYLIEESR